MSTKVHNHYKYNYLTNVIFRIDFPDMGFKDNKPPEEIIKELGAKFPNINKIKGKSVELKVKDFKHSTVMEDLVSWEFKNDQNQKRVIVNSDSLVLETLKYTGFEDFSKDIKFVVDKFGKNYPLDNINRLGLRFVNQIDIKPPKKPFDWESLIKTDLTSVLDSFVAKSNNISRSIQFLEFNEEDHILRFQFGMFNSEYPNVVSQKEFLLDYDCVTIGELSFNDIINTAVDFHKIRYEMCESSIDHGLREMMRDDQD